MRAAAETAPVQDVHVSTSAVQRRVRRNRSVRTGANVLVGAGAIAVVVAGLAVGPGAFAPPVDEGSRATGDDVGAIEPAIDGTSLIAPAPEGLGCGAPYAPSIGSDDRSDAVAAKSASLADPEDGVARYDVTYVAAQGGSFTISAPTAYILWEGTVVGVTYGDAHTELTGGEGAIGTNGVDLNLVSCWEGEALPAGDYTVVSHTTLWAAADEPAVDEPGDEPVEEPAPDGPVFEADPEITLNSEIHKETWENGPEAFTVIAPELELTVPGDPVEDPFGKYLGGGEPRDPVVPDGALTTDEARKAYEAALTTIPWTMAPGTQRVVLTGDGTWTDDLWNQSYFGCAFDGVSGAFPKQSADWKLLGVTGSLPSSINVSYGWVVDDNPAVSLTVTNTSEWSIPGYWAEPNSSLYLVKDGKVVAEAYPVSTNRNGPSIAIDSLRTVDAYGNGYLEPGKSISGSYIWRDVNGCWKSNNTAADVTPGTYTVLSAQGVNVGSEQVVLFGAEAQARGADGAGKNSVSLGDDVVSSGSGSGSAESPVSVGGDAVAPAPDSQDWVGFTVWTSLGTVTVTN